MKKLLIIIVLIFTLASCTQNETTIVETTSTTEITETTEQTETTQLMTTDGPMFDNIPEDLTIEVGYNLDLLAFGITATDSTDADISEDIVVDVSDTSVLGIGEHTVTFSVTDGESNTATLELPLIVIEDEKFDYHIVGEEIYVTGYSNGVDPEPLDLVIPNNLNGLPVTKVWLSGVPIGGPNFHDCNIVSVTIGPNITDVWPGKFSYNPVENYIVSEENQHLKSVDGVLFSKDGTKLIAYPNGKDDTTYVVPDGVNRIESRAFFESVLTSIVLPDSLLYIDDEAFAAPLTEITIPENVIDIGDNAFWGTSLTSIIINGVEARFNYKWDDIGFPTELMPFVEFDERSYDLGYGNQGDPYYLIDSNPLDFIHNDYVIVSDHNYGDQGALRIYSLHNPEYERIITGSNLSTTDEFGHSWKVMGDYLVTACVTYNNNQGAIYVYKLSDPLYERIITGSDSDENDNFSLKDVNNNYILACATGQNENTGAVYIFKLDDATYERKIVGSETTTNDHFGRYMSIYNNNYIIVTDLGDTTNRIKNLYIYKLDDTDYERLITETPSEGESGFGYRYKITDGYLIIEETLYGSNQINSFYIYNFDDPEYFGRITDEDLEGDIEFGFYSETNNHYLYFYAGSNAQKNEYIYLYYLPDLENKRIFSEDTFGAGYKIDEIDFTHDDYFVISAYKDASYLGTDYRKTSIGVFKLDDSDYSQIFHSGDYSTGITYNSFKVYDQRLILCGTESAYSSAFYSFYNLGNPDEIQLERTISDEGLDEVTFYQYHHDSSDFNVSESYFMVLSKDKDILHIYDWEDEQYRIDVIFEDIGIDYVHLEGIAFSDSFIYIPVSSEEADSKVLVIKTDDPYAITFIDTDSFGSDGKLYVYLIDEYIIVKKAISVPFSAIFYAYVFSNVFEFQD